MGLDATVLGIQVVFLVLIPGVAFLVGFRLTSGLRGSSELVSTCLALLFGVILLSISNSSMHGDLEKITQFLSNPFNASVYLAFLGVVLGFLLGMPIGWIRSKIR